MVLVVFSNKIYTLIMLSFTTPVETRVNCRNVKEQKLKHKRI